MTIVTIDETNLTNIANAIREKNGSVATYKPNQMAAAIQDISASEDLTNELDTQKTLLDNQTDKLAIAINTLKNKASGGDTSEIEDAFLTKTLTGDYYNDRITYLAYGAMAYHDVTSASFPNVTDIGNSAFYNCGNLITLNLPKVTNIQNYGIRTCISLKELILPSLYSMGSYAFESNKALELADLGIVRSIGSSTFSGCTSLKTLILRKADSITTLSSTNAFNNTPIASGTGYVYVVDALLEKYKVATNWSSFANQIKGLSELEETNE